MTVHPCEARRYLGAGLSEGGGGHAHLCPDTITHRITFTDTEGQRVAVAYACAGHAAEVVSIVTGQAGTPVGMLGGLLALPGEGERTEVAADVTLQAAGLGGVKLSAYRPRTAERSAAVESGVAR